MKIKTKNGQAFVAVVKNILHIYNKYPYYYILTSDGWQMTFLLMYRRKLD